MSLMQFPKFGPNEVIVIEYERPATKSIVKVALWGSEWVGNEGQIDALRPGKAFKFRGVRRCTDGSIKPRKGKGT